MNKITITLVNVPDKNIKYYNDIQSDFLKDFGFNGITDVQNIEIDFSMLSALREINLIATVWDAKQEISCPGYKKPTQMEDALSLMKNLIK